MQHPPSRSIVLSNTRPVVVQFPQMSRMPGLPCRVLLGLSRLTALSHTHTLFTHQLICIRIYIIAPYAHCTILWMRVPPR